MRTGLPALSFATWALLVSACSECPYVEQTIIVAQDDPELASLTDNCRFHVPPTNEPRCASGAVSSARFDCACLPLCDRVYAIIVPDPGRAPLEECLASSASSPSGATSQAIQEAITIKYRSQCP